ncbi:MAG: DUF4169 family protein [Pseudomonadota bacterium]
MADEPINLNKARKARAMAADKKEARENRVRFGQTGEERRAEASRKSADIKRLDDHKREKD